jgi:hypothetical protein
MRKELEQLSGKIFHKYFFLLLIIFSCFIFNNKASAQDTSASTKLRISILTCDAGSDLYTIWGHTAVRVVDSINNTDYVFNFGTFDFETPNFIAKFMRGDLNYFIAANDFSSFYKEYKDNGRAVHEQVLKLSATEKEKWYQALIINMREENKFYLYNFISDNCTTRIKDGLFKHAPINGYSIGINSYREEVVSATYKGGLGWIGLGIDLLLGATSDKTPNLFQEAFLPALLYKKIELNPKLVLAKNEIISNKQPQEKSINPITFLILFLLIYVFVSNWNALVTQKIAIVLDVTLLLVFGVCGSLVLYMSQFSLHTACHENYNIIWLHPLYLLVVPVYFISKKWTGYLGYLFFTATAILMFASHWIPQHFSKSVIVLMIIALYLQLRLIKRGSLTKYK